MLTLYLTNKNEAFVFIFISACLQHAMVTFLEELTHA